MKKKIRELTINDISKLCKVYQYSEEDGCPGCPLEDNELCFIYNDSTFFDQCSNSKDYDDIMNLTIGELYKQCNETDDCDVCTSIIHRLCNSCTTDSFIIYRDNLDKEIEVPNISKKISDLTVKEITNYCKKQKEKYKECTNFCELRCLCEYTRFSFDIIPPKVLNKEVHED